MPSHTESVPSLPDFHHELLARWERADGRYYLAHLHRDLFGTWCLTQVWGGKGRAGGAQRTQPLAGRDAGQQAFRTIARRRSAHCYQLHTLRGL